MEVVAGVAEILGGEVGEVGGDSVLEFGWEERQSGAGVEGWRSEVGEVHLRGRGY